MSILPQTTLSTHSNRAGPDWPGLASCLLCGSDSQAGLICDGCSHDLPLLLGPCCPQCASPTTFGERCGHCLHHPPHFAQATALFRYEFPVDRLIHAFKYGHQLALAGWFGKRLAQALAGLPVDRIVAMPLHPSRLRERGFNQAAEIARWLEKPLRTVVDRNCLSRRLATSPQASLPLQARHGNVRGAFECHVDLQGQHILLVDDVMTSGATADECARVLILHGAARVDIAVVARALRH